MMKKLTLNWVKQPMQQILWCMALILWSASSATAQNPLWALPTNSASTSSYYDWANGLIPLPTTDPATGLAYTSIDGGGYIPSQIPNGYAPNIQKDVNGNLLFFIVGNSIFDNQGRTIFNGSGFTYFSNSTNYGHLDEYTNQVVIVPNPDNCKQFYIFYPAIINENYLNVNYIYLLLDISVQGNVYLNNTNNYLNTTSNPNSNGQIVDAVDFNSLVYQNSGFARERGYVMTASNYDSINNKYYLFITKRNHTVDHLFVYEISNNGVNLLNDKDLSYTAISNGLDLVQFCREMEVYNTGAGVYKILLSGRHGLVIEDYNVATNTFTGFNYIKYTLNNQQVKAVNGLEFSPSGRYVYQTHTKSSGAINIPNKILCWDTQTGGFVNLPWQSQLNDEFKYSYIENQNGKLYLIKNDYMAEISNPDDPLNSTLDQTNLNVTYVSNEQYLATTDYARLKNYKLPHQIDQTVSGSVQMSPACCIALTVFDKEIFNAHTDASYTGTTQIWTPTNNPLNGGTGAEATIRKELNIPAGYKIIVKNMVIKFHPEAEVNIRRGDGTLPGGQLVLEKSTLTTYDNCGEHKLWQGVDVEGYVGLPQVPLNNTQQGLLDVKTGSKIEYAYVGAETIQKFGQWPFLSPDATYAGGIVRTKGGTWRNNQTDIRLQNYDPQNTYFNQSYINNSLFITDEVLDPQPKQIVHINLFDVTNILIQGNTFVNAASNLYLEHRRGYGILSVNSKFIVTPYPSNHNPNTFRKLTYGIYAQSANSFENAFIDQNVFRNNQYGVVLRNVDFSRVTRNNFRIAENSLGQKTVGINLVNSTGYHVEANTLSSMLGTSQVGNTFGIVVDNSGEANNLVYKNKLLNLLVGCQSQRVNAPMNTSTPNSYGGLKWQCNNFKKNIALTDIALTSGRMDYQQGVAAGGVVLPQFAGARNMLSHDVPAGTGQYDIAVNHIPDVVDYGINYGYYPSTFYSSNSITEPQMGNYTLPQVNGYVPVSLTAVVSPFIQFNYNQSCPSHIKIFISGGISPVSQSSVLSVKDQISSVQNSLNSVNQQALLNAINSGAMSNGQLKNLLLQNSPMLSDEVINAYILSSPPNGHLLQVLFNNGPLSSNVIQTLNDNNALPGWWLYMFNNYFQGVSPYNQMLGQLSYLNAEKDNLINEAIIYYTLTDTTILNPMDSVLAYLQLDSDNKLRRQQIVDAYIYKKDVQTASTKNNALINDYGQIYFTTLATERINNTYGACVVTNIDTNLQSKAVVQDIALNANNRIIKSKAKCLLKEYFNPDSVFVYIEDLYLPTNSNGNRLGNQDEEETKEPEQLEVEQAYIQPFELSVYPNPASHTIHIAIKGLDETENAIIEVVNVAGKVVYRGTAKNTILDVDVSDFPNGLYFVIIRTEKQMLKVEKIVVE